mmetsp:Transcript_37337/g.79335  ORF Transcript_37337/g.79335 Transcript_37337/m.79335 type:complete len:284 (+) Transcript_37337:766-1617(+)
MVPIGHHDLDDPEDRSCVPEQIIFHRHQLLPRLIAVAEALDVLEPPRLVPTRQIVHWREGFALVLAVIEVRQGEHGFVCGEESRLHEGGNLFVGVQGAAMLSDGCTDVVETCDREVAQAHVPLDREHLHCEADERAQGAVGPGQRVEKVRVRTVCSDILDVLAVGQHDFIIRDGLLEQARDVGVRGHAHCHGQPSECGAAVLEVRGEHEAPRNQVVRRILHAHHRLHCHGQLLRVKRKDVVKAAGRHLALVPLFSKAEGQAVRRGAVSRDSPSLLQGNLGVGG